MGNGKGRPVRVLIAKPGLDGHDVGARAVASALRDAGMEVIYTGLHQTPEQIVQAAIQEDVNVIGLSILSGAHIPICKKMVNLLEEKNVKDIDVFVGWVIPKKDYRALKDAGISGIFGQQSTFEEIIKFTNDNIKQKSGYNSPKSMGG
jgi:methylmalonyl-CoA mutase C-terminal domain/subunit